MNVRDSCKAIKNVQAPIQHNYLAAFINITYTVQYQDVMISVKTSRILQQYQI